MTSKMKWILIISVAIVVLGGGAAWYLLTRPAATTPNLNTNTPTNTSLPVTNTAPVPVDNTNTATPAARSEQEDKKSVLNLSRIFTERYGSYSNRNNFENITSLEPFMTQRFQTESLTYIAENQPQGIPEEYYGISTYVISLKLTSYVAKEAATVELITQREESTSTQDRKVTTQSVVVQLQSVSGAWKVDSITWK